ncbi:ABC transporter permease [candidate division KSB1 bacterium]
MSEKTGKPPLIIKRLLQRLTRNSDNKMLVGDCEEEFSEIASAKGIRYAKLWYINQLLISLLPFIKHSIFREYTMFKNYLKIALRNFKRYKGYSFINLIGLAIGLTSCILIFMYVSFEYSFDDYHPDIDRLYHVKMRVNSNYFSNYSSPAVIPALKESFPEVEEGARVNFGGRWLVKNGEKLFYEEEVLFSESELFNILYIPFIHGDPSTALQRPNTVVISERIAQKLFNRDDVVGESLTINMNNFINDYEITGVVEDFPENTHLKYDLIVSIKTVEEFWNMNNWGWTGFYSYIKLRPEVDITEFNSKIERIAYNYAREALLGRGVEDHTCKVFPLQDIYLSYSNSRTLYLKILTSVGIILLLIAIINYINLLTARSANRTKEIGIRKVAGAFRSQLIKQFLSESILMSVLSFLTALIIVFLLLPYFNSISGRQFTLNGLLQLNVMIPIILISLITGLFAGLYPAFFLASFKPVSVLKGSVSSGSKNPILRKILVTGQFAASILLIASTIIIFDQVNYMKNMDTGFNKEQKLVIPIKDGTNFELYKEEFLKHASIIGATASQDVPGRFNDVYSTFLPGSMDNRLSLKHHFADHDFFDVYDAEIIAGRPFMQEIKTDTCGPFIINESAVEAFGFRSPEEAIGKRINSGFFGFKEDNNIIIGVVKDFHFQGLQSEIEPLIIYLRPVLFNYISLNINVSDLNNTLSFVENKWDQFFPDDVFSYFFLDEDFDRLYHSEEHLSRIFSSLTILAILISCLGVFGLAAFMAEQRTKEIGIRRILGSSVTGIIGILLKEFVYLILAANIVALPAGYILLSKWLSNFAYRIELNSSVFLVSALLTVIIILFSVSYQIIKAAKADPVKSLRFE